MPKQEFKRTVFGVDYKWWVLVSVGVGTFMSALDASIVNVVLPVIRREFDCAGARYRNCWAVWLDAWIASKT